MLNDRILRLLKHQDMTVEQISSTLAQPRAVVLMATADLFFERKVITAYVENKTTYLTLGDPTPLIAPA